jgi:hypothetical protein
MSFIAQHFLLTAAQKCTIRLIMVVDSLSGAVHEATSAHVSVQSLHTASSNS